MATFCEVLQGRSARVSSIVMLRGCRASPFDKFGHPPPPHQPALVLLILADAVIVSAFTPKAVKRVAFWARRGRAYSFRA